MNINLLNVTKFTASLLLLLICGNVFSQAPQKMSYQAVIRNNSNVLVTSSPIGMKISILQGSSSGTAVYVETQTAKTNVNGLVSIEIGSGTVVTGTFAGINWGAGPYFVKTETDPRGGTAYSIAGTSQLMSVPYALFSANGGSGSQGPQGPQGPIGLTGPAGATGPQGPAGRDGSMLVDADATTKGKIQLAGDLGGSASAPTVPALANKVDKVDGKGLSTEDYTTTEKTKLAAITGTNTGDQDLSGLATTDAVDLKVDKVDGKGLSTEDYTTTEKTKLAAISGTNTGDQDLSGFATTDAVDLKVDKEDGKGLSTNDYTTPEKTKLAAITGTNTGDETSSTIKSKLGITTLSGSNTGDQDLSGFATIASPTFTGTVITPASTAAGAGLRIPHGVAPTTAVNGDIWTTSSGLFATIEGAVKQYPTLSDGNNFTGNNIFSGETLIFGNRTNSSIVNVGTGATLINETKTVNIATNGASGSNTNVNIGPIDGRGTTTLGQSTANSIVNIGTGATLENNDKIVNIATNGTLNSTSTVNIGPILGGGATTLGQSTATSTVNIGTGTTASSNVKTVNIATNGTVESTTEVNIGPTAGISNSTFGQSTANSTVNIGTGASVSGAIKTVNIATNGATDSTTEVKIGPTAGLGFITLGQSTANSTVNVGTGASVSGATKAVNIATNGATDSTTEVKIGSTAGLGTITVGQSTAASTVNIGTGAIASGIKTINIGTGGLTSSTTNTTIGTTSGGGNNVIINGTTTHNGLTVTSPSSPTTARLRLPPGAQPTTPANGDVWTQTIGLFAWINNSVKQFGTLQDGLIYSGNNTFAGPNLVFGN